MFTIKKSSSVKRNQVDNQIPSKKNGPKIDLKLGHKLRKINVLVIYEEDQIEITKEDFE